MKIFSPAFDDGHPIPKHYTQEGENISPPIAWTDLPPSTKELALICEDPDAPGAEPYIHWVAYSIDPKIHALPEAFKTDEIASLSKVVQGKNSAGKIGYVGPMPPRNHGWHRYYFRLFALDQKLNLQPGLTSDELLEAIRNHLVAEAETVGRYIRQPEEFSQASL